MIGKIDQRRRKRRRLKEEGKISFNIRRQDSYEEIMIRKIDQKKTKRKRKRRKRLEEEEEEEEEKIQMNCLQLLNGEFSWARKSLAGGFNKRPVRSSSRKRGRGREISAEMSSRTTTTNRASKSKPVTLNLLLSLSLILITFEDNIGRDVLLAEASSSPLTSSLRHQAATTQEIGEGLTLAGNYQQQQGSDNHSDEDGSTTNSERQQQLKQQQSWPMQHLDRIKNENKVSALVGQNVILNCAVQFKDGIEKPFVVNWLKYPHKLPLYIWYAGYPPHVAPGYENRVARIGQASLNLTQVRESDQGLYECKIHYIDRRPEDKGRGTWIFLDVQAPPHFTKTPASVSYVQAGDSLRLTCQAESTPTPILRWYKNKMPINSDSGAYRLLSSIVNNNNEDEQQSVSISANHQQTAHDEQLLDGHSLNQLDLFIENIQAGTTTGDYSCLASNSEGSVEAHSQVVLAVPAIITTMPRNQTKLEGEKVEFLCQAKALPSNITYKWLFNDKSIQTLKSFESRYLIKRDGTLVINSLRRDDQGEYKCQATNGLAHRNRQLVTSAIISSSKASITTTTTTTTTTSTSTSTSTTTSSSQDLIVSQNNGKSNNRNQAQIKEQQNLPAPIYAEASAHLNIEYPARIIYSPPVQYLPLGLSGVIRCFVQASPPVEFFTWTLNNQQFDPNIDQNVERLLNGSILIKQVSKHYEGIYRCTPFNKHGSAGSSSAMDVRVEEPPYFELKPAESYKADVNGQIKIPCDGKGSPKASVSWRKVITNDQLISDEYERELERRHRTAVGSSLNSDSYSTMIKQPTNKRRFISQLKQLSTTASSLVVDEAADEPNEDHHLYATTSSSSSSLTPNNMLNYENTHYYGQIIDNKYSELDSYYSETSNKQQSVITYAKLPADRSEYKDSHLLLHGLRKDDHGRYECVLENEVATLVASTMLYIQETTPHPPRDLQVETKAWSAQITWTPGYDGGFEQSFVVWYRQVDRPSYSTSNENNENYSQQEESVVSTISHQIPTSGNTIRHHEPIDFNWRPVSVPPSAGTTFTVQNLSQDTSYEFYVRAKNIIGEGPRSRIISTTTKRAISGSITPISNDLGQVAASTMDGGSEFDIQTVSSLIPSPAQSQDEEENEGPTLNPSVLGIIHLVDISSTPANLNSSSSDNQANSASQQAPGNYQQQSNSAGDNAAASGLNIDDANTSGASGGNSTNKVIRIFFPSKHQNSNAALANDSTTSNGQANNNKRPRFDQANQSPSSEEPSQAASSRTTTTSTSPTADQDLSTAPQNVSMTKVAQGWVLQWAAPQRLPSELTANERLEQAQQQAPSNNLLPALSQSLESSLNSQTTSSSTPNPTFPHSSSSSSSASTSASNSQPSVYSLEIREKGSAWQSLATSKERSILVKDLKPGSEYRFRVFAHTFSGLKGSPSPEFKYLIPDNRRKPGSTQALSAGVVSGILFFIACIVIAVCAVNMCNKRRKKRAEKAAYVMMACPVLESHHDIAALNSNSLMKNAHAEKGRISGVSNSVEFNKHKQQQQQQQNSAPPNSIGNNGQIQISSNQTSNSNYANQQRSKSVPPTTNLETSPLSSTSSSTAWQPFHRSISGTFNQLKSFSLDAKSRFYRYLKDLNLCLDDNGKQSCWTNGSSNNHPQRQNGALTVNSSEPPHESVSSELELELEGNTNRDIKFTSNSPIPVDVVDCSQNSEQFNSNHHRHQQQLQQGLLNQVQIKQVNSVLNKTGGLEEAFSELSRKSLEAKSAPHRNALTISEQRASKRDMDDYWVRQPSDRRFGTLTLAASKLAERRLAAKMAAEAGKERRTEIGKDPSSAEAKAEAGPEVEIEANSLAEGRFLSPSSSAHSEPDRSFSRKTIARDHNVQNRTLPRCFNQRKADNDSEFSDFTLAAIRTRSKQPNFHKQKQEQIHHQQQQQQQLVVTTEPATEQAADQIAPSPDLRPPPLPPKVPPRTTSQRRRQNLQQHPNQLHLLRLLHRRSLSGNQMNRIPPPPSFNLITIYLG